MAAAQSEDDIAIGIDLGTTFSCVAVFQNGKPKVIPNEHGNRITPSMVSFTDYGFLVGDEAKSRLTLDPVNTVYESKRLIGRTSDDPTIEHDKGYWPFEVFDDNGKPKIRVICKGEEKMCNPEEISAYVLKKMKKIAEDYLNQKVTKAVITVPAYFNESQRQATKDAARMANLEVLRIINEPTAAALAYGLQKNVDTERHVLVFDLGGGTFDVSVLRIDDGAIQVKGTGGNTHLGGADFDNKLLDMCINMFNKKEEVKTEATTDSSKREYQRLRKACELAKCQISTHDEEIIFVEMFHDNINLSCEITRKTFEEMIDNLLQETLEHLSQTLKDVGMSPDEIDDVVLVGGSTRIPKLRERLESHFKGKTLNVSINPDEAVACGAAIQAAILTGNGADELSDIVLIDVTPLSLGISIKGDIMLTIVKRNSLIPCRYTEEITTVSDQQTSIKVSVYQGERPLSKDNHYLGEFVLKGILPEPPGVPKVDATCNLDADGCLTVTATDKKTNKTESITIEPNKSRCSDKDIQRILEEAKEHDIEDAKEKQRIIARNKLDEFALWLKYILTNHQDKLNLSQSEKQSLFEQAKECLSWLNDNLFNDKTDYVQRLEGLEDVCSGIPSEYSTPGKLPSQLKVQVVGGYGVVCYSDGSDFEDVPDVD